MPVTSASIGAPAADRALREIVTPESVPLTVRLASRGERAGAVMLDLTFIFGSLFVLTLLFVWALAATGIDGPGELGIGLYIFLTFMVRSFYFIFFELRWDGVTPGKRIVRIRVVDREGGALTADAVFARNLMREVELFLPMTFLLAGPTSQTDAWFILAAIVWLGILVLMPLFNRDRLRVGDMIAGTWVIEAPKAALAVDIAKAARATAGSDALDLEGGYRFTRAELDVYGIHELQTLEDVLRDGSKDVMAEVAKRIRAKIGWEDAIPDGAPKDDRAFLEAFYRALRAELESKMLFGVRRRDKFDRG